MPLPAGQLPDPKRVYYYTGNDQNLWSPNPAQAKTLVKLPHSWSSISAGRIPDTGQWILHYQKTLDYHSDAHNAEDQDEGIYARIGSTPWEWSD